MPIFEYECKSCGHDFEQLVLDEKSTPDHCPKCRSKKIKKLLSATSFMSGSSIGSCSISGPKGFS